MTRDCPRRPEVLRQAFSVFCSAAPDYETLLRLIGPGLGDVEREAVVLGDIYHFVREATPFLAQLERLFFELRLEDTRKI
mmetsp:Transcript_16670/g.53680  ORF Transcript_16670/g.53680 Transcript_16670/m.53680 type:complete len:80 (+) Transcript_16670:2-241(+)